MKVSTNRASLLAACLVVLINMTLVQVTQAMYFYAEPDTWRCFQDTIVSNYVSHLRLQSDTCADT